MVENQTSFLNAKLIYLVWNGRNHVTVNPVYRDIHALRIPGKLPPICLCSSCLCSLREGVAPFLLTILNGITLFCSFVSRPVGKVDNPSTGGLFVIAIHIIGYQERENHFFVSLNPRWWWRTLVLVRGKSRSHWAQIPENTCWCYGPTQTWQGFFLALLQERVDAVHVFVLEHFGTGRDPSANRD